MENKKQYSYCGKCFTEEKDFEDISFEDDWDEIGTQCTKCKTDLYLVTGDTLPVKQPLIIKVGNAKSFDLNDWEKKRQLDEEKQDERLNEYIKDFGNFGREVAEQNYFKTLTNA